MNIAEDSPEQPLNALDRSSVVIAVLTYQRPNDIATIVPHLLAQADSVGACVLVVDNDPKGSAEDAVTAFSAPRLRYVNETRPGISAARNRALAESADMDLLVFIDDDETPAPGWLSALLAQYDKSLPTAVAGPVVSEFTDQPPPWVQDGDFFAKPRTLSGTQLPAAATNNLLLDLQRIRAMNLSFDERFGLSGGSDTLFTRQIVERGGSIVWCDEALVIDRIPAGRLSRAWVLRRLFRGGNAGSRVSLVMARGFGHRVSVRARLFIQGIVRIVAGTGRFLLGLATGKMQHRAKGLQTTARGAGILTGALGYVYSEYSRKEA